MTSILIIDGNNWFRRRAETSTFGNPVRQCYQEIQKSHYDVILLVWDGWHALRARRVIYPEYKSKRKPPADGIFESQNLFKKVAEFSKAVSIQIEGYEADDVIAKLVNQYRDIGRIVIDSNDADFAQLGVPMTRQEFPISPRWVALYKTLVGDSSDTIPGMKGFGKKAWSTLTDDHKLYLEHHLKLSDEDFDNIKSPVVFIGLKDALNKKVYEYLIDKEQLKQLRIYWKIVNFIPVSDDLINENSKSGLDRPDLAEEIFKEYML